MAVFISCCRDVGVRERRKDKWHLLYQGKESFRTSVCFTTSWLDTFLCNSADMISMKINRVGCLLVLCVSSPSGSAIIYALHQCLLCDWHHRWLLYWSRQVALYPVFLETQQNDVIFIIRFGVEHKNDKFTCYRII